MKEKTAQKEEPSIRVREKTMLKKKKKSCSLPFQSHIPPTNEEHELCPVVINQEFTAGKFYSCYLLLYSLSPLTHSTSTDLNSIVQSSIQYLLSWERSRIITDWGTKEANGKMALGAELCWGVLSTAVFTLALLQLVPEETVQMMQNTLDSLHFNSRYIFKHLSEITGPFWCVLKAEKRVILSLCKGKSRYEDEELKEVPHLHLQNHFAKIKIYFVFKVQGGSLHKKYFSFLNKICFPFSLGA